MLRRLLILTCVTSHLLLLIGLATCFGGCFSLSHEQVVYAHIVLLSVASLAAVCRPRISVERKDWMLLAIMVLYGLSVLVPTASTHSMSLCTVEVCLTPLTIFCFAWALPGTLVRKDLEVVFLVILSVFTAHALLTAGLVATETHSVWGQELSCGTGRPQLYWGKRGALLTGLFVSPNALASYLILLPALAYSMAARWRRTWRRTLLISCGTLLLLHLLLLMSRASSLTTLVALAVAGVSSKLLRPSLRLAALGAMLIALFCACYALFDWRYDNSMCLRSFIWQGFLDAILENPFGSGWNGAAVFNQNPHSCLLANLVYFGVVGTVLLSALLIVLMRRGAQACRGDRASIALFLSIASMLLIHGSVEYVITYPLLFSNSMFWLVLGYLQMAPAAPTNRLCLATKGTAAARQAVGSATWSGRC